MAVRIFYPPYSFAGNAPDWYSDDGRGSMRNGEYIFSGNYESRFNADWLVSGDTPYRCFRTNIPRERRILFVDEPPEIREYKHFRYYTEQYGTIISPYEIPGYTGRTIISNPHLGWLAGIRGEMDSLTKAKNFPMPQKTHEISIISSMKHKTEYHRRRSAFMFRVKEEFGDMAECFGNDTRRIDDKIDAIAPYKYHIAIENSRHKFYWTEKLTDAWLCWSLPIYCGDPSILKQVPDKRGIEVIDIDDFPSALRRVHEIIDRDIYSSRLDAIRACREWVLKESNRYELACDIIAASNDKTPRLEPPEMFRILISYRKNLVYKALRKISGKFADRVFDSYCRKRGWVYED